MSYDTRRSQGTWERPANTSNWQELQESGLRSLWKAQKRAIDNFHTSIYPWGYGTDRYQSFLHRRSLRATRWENVKDYQVSKLYSRTRPSPYQVLNLYSSVNTLCQSTSRNHRYQWKNIKERLVRKYPLRWKLLRRHHWPAAHPNPPGRLKTKKEEKEGNAYSHNHSKSSCYCEYTSSRHSDDYKVNQHDKESKCVKVLKQLKAYFTANGISTTIVCKSFLKSITDIYLTRLPN